MGLKRFLCIFLILLSLCVVTLASTIQKDNEIKISDRLSIKSSKNLALFHIMVMLTPSGERMKEWFAYKIAEDARKYFSKYKDHKAIQMTEQLMQQMWYLIFNHMAIYYSDVPEFKLIVKPPEEFEQYKKIIENYLNLARDFYKTSNFEQFWTENTKGLQDVVDEQASRMPNINIPDIMEKYYGDKADAFCIIPAPFLTASGYNVTTIDMNDKKTFYFINGMSPTLSGGESGKAATAYLAFHEFGHCFVEPIVALHLDELNKYSDFYEPLRERFTQMGYRNWERAFVEQLIHANQVHLMRQVYGESAANQVLERERRRGLLMIDVMHDITRVYADHRSEYKDFKSFFPYILKRLADVKIVKYRKPGSFGFNYEFKEAKCIITSVLEGSFFQKEDITKDSVILSIAGMNINSEEDLNKAIAVKNNAKEGDKISFKFIIDGKNVEKSFLIPFIDAYRYELNPEK